MTYLILNITMLFILITCSIARYNTVLFNRYYNIFIGMILFILSCIWIGLRDYDVFPDTIVYYNVYEQVSQLNLSDSLEVIRYENSFVFLQWFSAYIGIPSRVFMLLIYILFLGTIVIGLRKIFKQYLIFILFIYINFPFFIALGGNIIRHGISLAFLLLAIATLMEKNKKTKGYYLYLIISGLFHYSALPIVVIMFLFNFIKTKVTTILVFWLICLTLFLFKISDVILKIFPHVIQLDTYSSESTLAMYGSNYRIDFLIFSSTFLIFGLFINYFVYKNENSSYSLILNMYMIFNSYFLIMGFIAFSDRVAIFSWMLIPMLVFFPVFTLNKRYPFVIALLITISFFGLCYLNLDMFN
ncbi:EpsG family protein [Peribacillus frigoritolerans]|uniref:EpsG family protein n=1 Tax=Peribacillus frigoritolerans TaxID=450367 RepID=UPI003D281DD2